MSLPLPYIDINLIYSSLVSLFLSAFGFPHGAGSKCRLCLLCTSHTVFTRQCRVSHKTYLLLRGCRCSTTQKQESTLTSHFRHSLKHYRHLPLSHIRRRPCVRHPFHLYLVCSFNPVQSLLRPSSKQSCHQAASPCKGRNPTTAHSFSLRICW